MGFSHGDRLGLYEVAGLIGKGGMGEVYRARDTKLNRHVALKVLLPAVANDPDRMARFSREAQVLASLNHPNIAQIYGLEESDGVRALVMELVEGPTLAERILAGSEGRPLRDTDPRGALPSSAVRAAPSGRPIPLDEALPIAKQIADALEAAHEQGVIHRDLKPANIKVREDGTVKVLDFGLAKALDLTGEMSPSGSQSPTITTPAMTHAGIILGTAAYMSPEQARGRAVDKRADIWSFGCVLYEMLTGRRAFDGDDISITLASVLKDDVEWGTLPADLPSSIRRLLRRCLEKDPRRRLGAVSDARLELDDAAAPVDRESAILYAPAAAVVVPGWKRALPWMLAAAGLGAAVVSILYPRPAPTIAAPRLKMTLETRADENWAEPAISPDGTRIAFRTNAGILVRAVDALEGQVLKASSVAGIAWSPDSRSLVFCNGDANELRTISIDGGTPQTIGSGCSPFRGAAWNTDGTILFGAAGQKIMRIPENGGTAVPISAVTGLHPTMLPDRRHYLFLAGQGRGQGSESGPSRSTGRGQGRGQGGESGPGGTAIYAGAVDSSDAHKITDASSKAEFTSSGHLVFLRGTTLMAQPFDAAGLRTTGEAFPVASDVAITAISRSAHFSTAPNGLIVYLTGSVGRTALTWFDRRGATMSVLTDVDLHQDVAISQDGHSVAATRMSPKTLEPGLWITDLSRGIAAPLTTDSGNFQFPAWSPDGTRVAYAVAQEIYVSDISGSGSRELLARRGSMPSWSPDGNTIVFVDAAPVGSLRIVPTSGDRTSVLFLAGQFVHPAFSPDGRWMAYASQESGQFEVFVQSVPAGRGKWRISPAGGAQPTWRRDGRELFYRASDGGIMAVPIAIGATLTAGVPTRLFDATTPGLVGVRRQYAVSPDGQRFLVNVTLPDRAPTILLQNWLTQPGKTR